MQLKYEICDVFTDRALAGNALAVFTDADGLDERTMQALAREVNLSESAFLQQGTNGGADARLRIFTPTMELPFAGHPTLGAGFVLRGMKPETSSVRLETGRGTVEVSWMEQDSAVSFGWMTQPIPVHAPFLETEKVWRALRIAEGPAPLELYDNGPRYVLVEASNPALIAEMAPDLAGLAELGSFAFVVFASQGERWKVRVFAPGEGIPEDPATGAAAGALVVHLCRQERVPFGAEVIIEQGREIARPSTLYARALGSAGCIERVEVGGHVVRVATGQFSLPGWLGA